MDTRNQTRKQGKGEFQGDSKEGVKGDNYQIPATLTSIPTSAIT